MYKKEMNESCSCDKRVKITVTGTGGHSSSPHLARNALIIAGQIIQGINSEIAYQFAADERPTIKPTSLIAGTVGNVIPATAEIQYEYLTFSKESQRLLNKIFREIPVGIAEIHGASCLVVI